MTNYEKYFGTPERAAGTMTIFCNNQEEKDPCATCQFWGFMCPVHNTYSFGDWLQEECDD